jgi:hypothetical protein
MVFQESIKEAMLLQNLTLFVHDLHEVKSEEEKIYQRTGKRKQN